MNKVVVFLAEGFEEVEAITQVDFLRRVGLEVDMVSITDDKSVVGAHNITVLADKSIDEIDEDSYDMIVLPGGMPGSSNLRDSERVISIVKKYNESNKFIAAICAAPIVLAEAGASDGKFVTSYPGFENELASAKYLNDGIVVDKNIITGRGPAYAGDFAYKLVEVLKDEDIAEDLKKDTLYSER